MVRGTVIDVDATRCLTLQLTCTLRLSASPSSTVHCRQLSSSRKSAESALFLDCFSYPALLDQLQRPVWFAKSFGALNAKLGSQAGHPHLCINRCFRLHPFTMSVVQLLSCQAPSVIFNITTTSNRRVGTHASPNVLLKPIMILNESTSWEIQQLF